MEIKKLYVSDKLLTYKLYKNKDGWNVLVTDTNGQEKNFLITHVHFKKQTNTLFFQYNNIFYKIYITASEIGKQQWHVFSSHLAHQSEEHIIKSQKEQPVAFHPQSSNVGYSPAISVRPQNKNILKSPLAGRIIKVLVQPNQSVARGQPLVLIESMKMENEICAPSSAFIKTIFITDGNVVKPNQILIEFEKEGEGNVITKNRNVQETISNR